MCGIAGYISFNQKNDFSKKKIIEAMLDVTVHRGPDEKKYLFGKNYAFGTNRLAIQKIKKGQQPIDDGRFILGFNGEIFNYETLKKNIIDQNVIESEIELILYLYKKYGSDFVYKLKGQFAIYIYDKFNNKIFLFRDRFGIRPLFYSIDKKNGEIIFASECKQFLKFLKSLMMFQKRDGSNFYVLDNCW